MWLFVRSCFPLPYQVIQCYDLFYREGLATLKFEACIEACLHLKPRLALAVPLRQLRPKNSSKAAQLPTTSSSTLLGLQQWYCIVSSPRSKPRFVLVPIRFASKAGLDQASPSLEAPRLQALEIRDLFQQQNRKGKIVMTKTSRHKEPVLGSFLVPEIDMIFGDGVGASLARPVLPSRCWFDAFLH